ncbi:MAG TPA: glycine-rich protein [Solirubrobacteraceae bacterium]|nr:glycine-rich protein [Solirubrobacteraceae bacterium]
MLRISLPTRNWGVSVLGVTVAGLTASAASGVVAAGPALGDTFTYTGAQQTYTVPAGITGLHVVLVGATGASETVPDLNATGGHGARLTGDIPVPAGITTLYVEVGGDGISASPPSVPYTAAGGFNGGGNGPFGGGGASDIRTVANDQPNSLSSRLAVAGGGGGGGGNSDFNANGGDAGNPDGSGNAGVGLASGAGAATVAGGLAADQATITFYCQGAGDVDGEHGDPGTSGAGGNGAFIVAGTPISGGGGGGLTGGGGGAQCYRSGGVATQHAGAGGGGSSGAPSGQNVQIATDSSDPAEVMITAPVPAVAAPPTTDGGLTVGDVQAESHAPWSSSLPLSAYAYQWERCDAGGGSCAAIGGATGQTYRLVSADIGHTLRVQETAANFYGPASTAAVSAATGLVRGTAPTTIDPPTIAGTATPGHLLVETHAPWSGGPITGYADAWERCDASGGSCRPIAGAVNQTYTPVAADIGSTLRVQETATNAYGTSAPLASAPTAVVQAPAGSDRSARLSIRSAHFAAGAVWVRLACASDGRPCTGGIRLGYTAGRARAKRPGKTGRPRRTLMLGRARYAITPGHTETIRVALNRPGRHLLTRLHKLVTHDTLTLQQPAGQRATVASFTLTLTAPARTRR